MKLLLLVVGLSLPLAALGEESAPCREEAGRVCCESVGFGKLVAKLVEARRDRDLCRVDLAACRDDLRITPTPPPAAAWKPVATFALGVAGTALLTVPWLLPNTDPALRLGLSAAGAVGVGAGFWLAF